MFEYLANDERFTYTGAPGLRIGADGAVEVRRVPASYQNQIPTEIMRAVADTAAGVRLQFRSAASRVEIQFRAHQIAAKGAEPPLTGFQLLRGGHVSTYVAAQPFAWLDPATHSVARDAGRICTAVFENIGHTDGDMEVLLPNGAVIDVLRVSADAEIERTQVSPLPSWVHYGSSISHCSTAVEPLGAWPVRVAHELRLSLYNLAVAGNAMLDPFMARIIRDLPASFISLKVGINLINAGSMSVRAFAPVLHGFLDTIREGQPTTPILLISPIACSAVEDQPGPTMVDTQGMTTAVPIDRVRGATALTQARIRAAMKEVVLSRREPDSQLTYLDGRRLFSAEDESRGHLTDGLHPDARGNDLIGQRFAEVCRSLSLAAT